MSKIVSTGKTISLVEYHNRRVQERRRKLAWVFFSILGLLVALVFISRLEIFRISEVAVEGAKVIANEEAVRNVLATLSGKYFWLVPKSNAAIFPREEVAASLMKEFPRLASVELNVEGENTLRILVTEREPYALFCPPVGEKCFFLDKEGFVFDEAPDFSGVVYFIYETEIPAEEFKSLSTFIEGLSKLGFEPVRLGDYDLTMNNGSR
ncbi:MAG: FtsQ-type POTRA domain-containing protein, partial [Patescibacteria group bacterium]